MMRTPEPVTEQRQIPDGVKGVDGDCTRCGQPDRVLLCRACRREDEQTKQGLERGYSRDQMLLFGRAVRTAQWTLAHQSRDQYMGDGEVLEELDRIIRLAQHDDRPADPATEKEELLEGLLDEYRQCVQPLLDLVEELLEKQTGPHC